MADIAKINGIDIANVAKINGIDIANIAKINGQTVSIGIDYEDLTYFNVIDSDSDITVTANRLDFDSMRRDATAYVFNDYGVGFFTDFEIEFEFAITNGGYTSQAIFAAIGNTPGTLSNIDGTRDAVTVFSYEFGGGARIYLADYDNYVFDYYQHALSGIGPIYCTLTRSGTTATLAMYTDAAKTTLLDTLSVTCTAVPYRYLTVCASLGSGVDPAYTQTGYTKDFKII